MTIKQQGGIFGRNPTFNDLEVDGTLTSSDVDINGGAIDGTTIGTSTIADATFDSVRATGLALGRAATDNQLDLYDPVSASWSSALKIWGNGSSRYLQLKQDGSSTNFSLIATGSGTQIDFGAASTVTMTLNSSGNLAFANGKGIDFSATSGTGTSELFDDYEEGNWVPVLTDFTNNSPTSARGAYYTKVGNIVFASCNFINVDTTGMTSGAELYLDGLPYTSKSTTGTNYFVAGGVQYSGTSVTNQPIPSIVDGTDYMRFFDSGTFWNVSNLTDDAADLYINVVYLAA